MASSGIFLTFLASPAFLGTRKESYYSDNEPINDFCVDLSDGASEANLKI